MRGAQHNFRAFHREDWMEGAVCAQTDPELFFAEKGDWAKTIRAKLVCRRCPVIEQCLAYALENNIQFGVWGGTTVEQRKRLRSEHRAGNRGLAG